MFSARNLPAPADPPSRGPVKRREIAVTAEERDRIRFASPERDGSRSIPGVIVLVEPRSA